MKGIKLFFIAGLAFTGIIANAFGVIQTSTPRSSTRRDTGDTVSASRPQAGRATSSVTTTAENTRTKQSQATRSRTASSRNNVTNQQTTGSIRTPTTASPGVSARTSSVQSALRNTVSRPIVRTTAQKSIPATRTRAAISGPSGKNAADIMGENYKQCREVFYSCMDEFCANKDSQLKRCACSIRSGEFDNTRKQLANIEEKMLDFSQRLLTVNMDAEDAAAISTATEGEIAFQTTDKTKSKKMLDEIKKKLNNSFNDNNFEQDLGAISLSLNEESAFDSVDSLSGASTTTKIGIELYDAALPICREMSLEICTEDELYLAESSYQVIIEQDCNTVAKSYQTQTDQARAKIYESSALLDMSRLDIHQKRNSDDILTCKNKMLSMLTNTTVCGTNLHKCLDTSGRYIDPSTGEAFLTVDLANLGNLITRPENDGSWSDDPNNESFVLFLDSKKKFLEPAMESCQDISDYVWDAFIEDALSQIKLAQDRKLEDMRQSCTTLLSECLDTSATSLSEFDARALSVFGVAADKTVNAMCSDVRTACTALLERTGGAVDWIDGVTEIATEKTYDTIINTCREIGRDCIIQTCKSVSGNFGLCENIRTSVNRKSIINRTACWDTVQECIASASNDSIANITDILTRDNIIGRGGSFYATLYGVADEDIFLTNISADEVRLNVRVYDLCATECGLGSEFEYTAVDTNECRICRLTEQIWGNCEYKTTQGDIESNLSNQIRIPTDNNETLLSWFAKNTNTEYAKDSCRDTTCDTGYIPKLDPENNIIGCERAP